MLLYSDSKMQSSQMAWHQRYQLPESCEAPQSPRLGTYTRTSKHSAIHFGENTKWVGVKTCRSCSVENRIYVWTGLNMSEKREWLTFRIQHDSTFLDFLSSAFSTQNMLFLTRIKQCLTESMLLSVSTISLGNGEIMWNWLKLPLSSFPFDWHFEQLKVSKRPT